MAHHCPHATRPVVRPDRLTRHQAVPNGSQISQPTPYHFKVLLARAQQLTQQAQQIETQYLAALEKYDNKNLQQSDAQQAAETSDAKLKIHDAQVTEAADAVAAAAAQATKATAMQQAYTEAINSPPNQYEQALLSEYPQMRDIKDTIGGLDATIGIAQAAAQASSATDFILSFGWKQIATAVQVGAIAAKAGFQMHLNNIESQMQANQLQASRPCSTA